MAKPATTRVHQITGLPDEGPESIQWYRYYRDLGVWPGWTVERFHKACAFLRETPEEVAHSCCVPTNTLRRHLEKGYFPPYLSLLFHMREQHFIAEKLTPETPCPSTTTS